MPSTPPDLALLRLQLLSQRAVLDEVGAYVFTKDLEGRYTYANRFVQDLFGCPLEQVIGRDDTHFFDLEQSSQLRENDRQVMDQARTIEAEEINVIKATGEQRIYHSVKKPVYDEAGRIVGMCGISTDITERKRLEAELAKQRQLLEAVLNHVDAYIYIRDDRHRYHYVNRKVAELLGKPLSEILGRTDEELRSVTAVNDFFKLDQQVFASGERQAGPESFIDEQGRTRYCWSVKVPFDCGVQQPTLIGFSSDITELYLLQKELERLSTTDALTELCNRRSFLGAAEHEFTRANRYRRPLALLMLDIDHFKTINDRFGHPDGDRVLQEFAQRLREGLRREDLPARLGGEEFAVLLPETDQASAMAVAERIRSAVLGRPFSLADGRSVPLTVSAGLSLLAGADESFHSLYSRADQLLYKAKHAGRNQVCASG